MTGRGKGECCFPSAGRKEDKCTPKKKERDRDLYTLPQRKCVRGKGEGGENLERKREEPSFYNL